MNSLLFFAAILIVLFLPGTAWMALIRSGRMDPLEKLAEAAGASLALTGLAGVLATQWWWTQADQSK